jgi:microcystin-dependent protein
MAQIQKGTTYTASGEGSLVTYANLNQHVDSAILLNGAITEQTPNGVSSDTDKFIISKGGALYSQTKAELTHSINSNDIHVNELDTQTGTFDDIVVNDSATVGGNLTVTGTVTTGGIPIQPSNFVPAGAVMPFAGTTAPTGWLKCSGQAVSRTTYATLFAYIGTTYGSGDNTTTFNLPDLRAEFIRGLDDGRMVDNGRAIGSAQGDLIRKHKHNTSNSDCQDYTSVNGLAAGQRFNTWCDTNGVNWNGYAPLTGDGTHGEQTGSGGGTSIGVVGEETRPRNIAMLYCIKY